MEQIWTLFLFFMLHFSLANIIRPGQNIDNKHISRFIFSWAKAPALYVTMSQVVGVVEEEVHFLDLAFRA